MEKVRICKICGEEKPISDFYPCYAKKDWYRKELMEDLDDEDGEAV